MKQNIDLYLSILQRIKLGDSPAKISLDLNFKKQRLNYYISTLKKYGCIKKIGYGTWEFIKDYEHYKHRKVQKTIEIGIEEVKDVSLIKLKKILKRQKLDKCIVCGFVEIIELHHIKALSKGGDNSLFNIIPLCPNHHTLMHKGGSNKFWIKKKIDNYFNELKKRDYLKSNLVRGHGFLFKLELPGDFRNWEKREETLKKLKVKFDPYYVGGIVRGQRMKIQNTKVALTDKSIIINFPESYIAETSKLAKGDAIAKFLRVVKALEKLLRADFSNFGKYKFKVARQHYALIKNSLARQYLEDGKKLEVYSGRGLWLLIDNSYNLAELETVHPKTADKDNAKVQNFFNGLDMVEGFTPQFVLRSLAENNSQLLEYSKQNKEHLNLIQEYRAESRANRSESIENRKLLTALLNKLEMNK